MALDRGESSDPRQDATAARTTVFRRWAAIASHQHLCQAELCRGTRSPDRHQIRCIGWTIVRCRAVNLQWGKFGAVRLRLLDFFIKGVESASAHFSPSFVARANFRRHCKRLGRHRHFYYAGLFFSGRWSDAYQFSSSEVDPTHDDFRIRRT